MSRISSTLLVVLALFVTATVATAQTPPPGSGPPNGSPPPLLDDPDHWEVHDAAGPMGYEFTAEYLPGGGDVDVYETHATETVNGQLVSEYAWVFDFPEYNGLILHVYNPRREAWSYWTWEGDHYKRHGQTSHVRTFHPVD